MAVQFHSSLLTVPQLHAHSVKMLVVPCTNQVASCLVSLLIVFSVQNIFSIVLNGNGKFQFSIKISLIPSTYPSRCLFLEKTSLNWPGRLKVLNWASVVPRELLSQHLLYYIEMVSWHVIFIIKPISSLSEGIIKFHSAPTLPPPQWTESGHHRSHAVTSKRERETGVPSQSHGQFWSVEPMGQCSKPSGLYAHCFLPENTPILLLWSCRPTVDDHF